MHKRSQAWVGTYGERVVVRDGQGALHSPTSFFLHVHTRLDTLDIAPIRWPVVVLDGELAVP